jgi:hypothetical protein
MNGRAAFATTSALFLVALVQLRQLLTAGAIEARQRINNETTDQTPRTWAIDLPTALQEAGFSLSVDVEQEANSRIATVTASVDRAKITQRLTFERLNGAERWEVVDVSLMR